MSKRKTTEQFITEANLKHNNRYDYSKTKYFHSEDFITVICSEHGEFQLRATNHLKGQGCQKCSLRDKANRKRKTTEQFIIEANLIHKNKYDYSKSKYIHSEQPILITCLIHGDFEQIPNNHLQGNGCPKCARENISKTTEQFIIEANSIHQNKYDYSKTKYINNNTKITITCPIHGDFEQIPHKHLSGQGCYKCSVNDRVLSQDEFIHKAILIHQDTYHYSKTKYVSSKEKITITCPIHGDFEQRPNGHLSGKGCIKCARELQTTISKSEQEIYDYITGITHYDIMEILQSDRTQLDNTEIDIFIPEKKIGFEFNGLYFHSDVFRDDKYHLNKLNECVSKGIRLIQIFEDEWHNKKEICQSRITNILGKTQNKIYARNCIVKEINNDVSKYFLNKNHIQGYIPAKIQLGLCDKITGELQCLMTFGNLRINLGNKVSNPNEYELIRFCNKLNTSVIGGANKLLKYFEKHYNPKRIISYADKRWSDGRLYFNLGFEHKHDSEPNYFYVSGLERKNRFQFRKDILVSKHNCPTEMTEREFCKTHLGMNRIYDCGTMVFEKII